MKQFTKICLILAAVLAVLGILGLGTGLLLGASPNQLMRQTPVYELQQKYEHFDDHHEDTWDLDLDWDLDEEHD